MKIRSKKYQDWRQTIFRCACFSLSLAWCLSPWLITVRLEISECIVALQLLSADQFHLYSLHWHHSLWDNNCYQLLIWSISVATCPETLWWAMLPHSYLYTGPNTWHPQPDTHSLTLHLTMLFKCSQPPYSENKLAKMARISTVAHLWSGNLFVCKSRKVADAVINGQWHGQQQQHTFSDHRQSWIAHSSITHYWLDRPDHCRKRGAHCTT